jgi:hypothetical protein
VSKQLAPRSDDELNFGRSLSERERDLGFASLDMEEASALIARAAELLTGSDDDADVPISPRMSELRDRAERLAWLVEFRYLKTVADARGWRPTMSLGPVEVIAAIAASQTVIPFLRAACEELGKRFGGSITDWMSKVKVKRRNGRDEVAVISQGDAELVVTLLSEVPPAAAASALELPQVGRRRVRWNPETRVWDEEDRPLIGEEWTPQRPPE